MENEEFEAVPEVPKNSLKSLQTELESLVRWKPSKRDSISVLEAGYKKILVVERYLEAYVLTQSSNRDTYNAKIEIRQILSKIFIELFKIPFPQNKEVAYKELSPLYENLNTALILLKLVNRIEEIPVSPVELYRSDVLLTIYDIGDSDEWEVF